MKGLMGALTAKNKMQTNPPNLSTMGSENVPRPTANGPTNPMDGDADDSQGIHADDAAKVRHHVRLAMAKGPKKGAFAVHLKLAAHHAGVED